MIPDKLVLLGRAAVLGCTAFVANQAFALDVTVNPGGNLQTALNTVGNAGGGTVYVNSATYTITTTLKIPNNTRIKGVTTRPLIQMFAGTNLPTVEPTSNPFTNVTCDFISLNGGVTNAQMDAGTHWGTRAFHFSDGISGTNVQVWNSNVTNACSGITTGEVTTAVVDSVNITNCGAAGSPGMHNMYISNTNPFTIRNSNVSNCRTGMGLKIQDSSGTLTETTQIISGNVFDSNYDRGMAVYRVNSLQITNNKCRNNGKSGINLITCVSPTLNGNTATGNPLIVDVSYDIWLNGCTNITQSGNTYGSSRGF